MADSQNTPILRTCTHCGEGKPATLEYFPPHKMGKYGLHSWCKPCKRAIDAARRERPDQKARQQAWRDANKEKVRQTNLAYRSAGYSSTKHVAEWRAANIEHSRRQVARRVRERRATDPAFALLGRLRSQLRSMVTRGRLRGGKAGRRTHQVFPFTVEDLMAHLERQFAKGMSWDNMGEWHIDHIIPIKSFNVQAVGDDEFLACWALTNLRPLWAEDNVRKGSRREFLV